MGDNKNYNTQDYTKTQGRKSLPKRQDTETELNPKSYQMIGCENKGGPPGSWGKEEKAKAAFSCGWNSGDTPVFGERRKRRPVTKLGRERGGGLNPESTRAMEKKMLQEQKETESRAGVTGSGLGELKGKNKFAWITLKKKNLDKRKKVGTKNQRNEKKSTYWIASKRSVEKRKS